MRPSASNSKKGLSVSCRRPPSIPGAIAKHRDVAGGRDVKAGELRDRRIDQVRERLPPDDAIGHVGVEVDAVIGPDLAERPQTSLDVDLSPHHVIAMHDRDMVRS